METSRAVPCSHDVAALREYPTKLFVETTSRCNLNCIMCMKQNRGSGPRDGDLDLATFTALEAALPRIDTLVLNGIGEPLLNTRLEQFITRARKMMPAHGWIGFQTNGVLLTDLRALTLLDAGVDRICLSMDGVEPATFGAIRAGGKLRDLEAAFSALDSAKAIYCRPELQVGVEYVVMRDNLAELPAALEWAASRGANFAIVSHLHPFDEQHASQCAYDLCTDRAMTLFQSWKEKADLVGVDIHRYFEVLWKYGKTPEEQRIVNFVESMKAHAQYSDITLDLKRLFAIDYSRLEEVTVAFDSAREVAAKAGLDLKLPEIVRRERRSCDFVAQGGAFISWDGRMHPCYHLWHQCSSFANGWLHPVQPQVFGSVLDRDILDIWNSEQFHAYRRNVLRHDYPSCGACSLSPCAHVQSEEFSYDCYVNTEPCGCCLWSSGVFRCLD